MLSSQQQEATALPGLLSHPSPAASPCASLGGSDDRGDPFARNLTEAGRQGRV